MAKKNEKTEPKSSAEIAIEIADLRKQLREAKKAELRDAKLSVVEVFAGAGLASTAEDFTALAERLRALLEDDDFALLLVGEEPEPEPETEPETVSESEPETVSESEPETEPESEPETGTESESESVESELETVSESEPETGTESNPVVAQYF